MRYVGKKKILIHFHEPCLLKWTTRHFFTVLFHGLISFVLKKKKNVRNKGIPNKGFQNVFKTTSFWKNPRSRAHQRTLPKRAEHRYSGVAPSSSCQVHLQGLAPYKLSSSRPLWSNPRKPRM